MAFTGLPRATLGFLADLAAHNRRDWFEANRARYEAEWLKPALALAAAMAPPLAALKPPLLSVPKLNHSLRRIHRDVRFAADKRPYAPWLHLIFSTGPTFNRVPGFHLVLTPEGLGYGAGHYAFTPETLDIARRRICLASERAALLAALDQAAEVGSRLDEPELARLPKGHQAEEGWEHLLRHKTLIVRTSAPLPPPDWLFTPECPQRIAAIAGAHVPLLAWLMRLG